MVKLLQVILENQEKLVSWQWNDRSNANNIQVEISKNGLAWSVIDKASKDLTNRELWRVWPNVE